jgi:hypothetical protein
VHSTDRSLASRSVKLAVFCALFIGACSSTQSPAPVVKAPTPKAAPPEAQKRADLPPPTRSANWDQYRLQAAHRIVAANEGQTYLGEPPEQLLAIPVLEIELDANGSIKRITVLRYPTQAEDTTQLAVNAVRRAAPFGDVSRLPRPWKFVETFLFDDDRHFKPRSLD